MKTPKQSCKEQESVNSSISYRAFRNILIAIALCLSYLIGKLFHEHNVTISTKAMVNYITLKKSR